MALFVLAAVGEHFFSSSCPLVTRSQTKQWPPTINISLELFNIYTIISLDAGEQFSQKEQLKVDLIHFLIDTPPHGTPRWRQSHDLVMQTYVSCNGSIPAIVPLLCDVLLITVVVGYKYSNKIMLYNIHNAELSLPVIVLLNYIFNSNCACHCSFISQHSCTSTYIYKYYYNHVC